MAYQFPADIQLLIEARMAAGGYVTEDDLLRDALEGMPTEAEELAAIQEAVREWQTGEPFLPVAKVFDDIRRQSQANADA